MIVRPHTELPKLFLRRAVRWLAADFISHVGFREHFANIFGGQVPQNLSALYAFIEYTQISAEVRRWLVREQG